MKIIVDIILKIIASLTLMALIELVVVAVRDSQAELMGSDLSLYGYGVAVGLLTRACFRKPMLPSYTFDFPSPMFLIFFTFGVSILVYALNINYYSKTIKKCDKDFNSGINSVDLWKKMMHNRRAKRLWQMSVTLGAIPGAFLANLIIFFG